MISANNVQSWVDHHRGTESSEPEWLAKKRQAAIQSFTEVGLPTLRNEDWRYTSLRKVLNNEFSIETKLEAAEAAVPATGEFPRIVFVNGLLLESASTALSLDGVSTLSETLAENPMQLTEVFGTTVKDSLHGFVELNTAYAKEGYVISIGKNAVLDQPIEVLYLSLGDKIASHARNIINAEANSQLTVVERHLGANGNTYLNNSVTEIIAGDNAHVSHYKIHQESDNGTHIGGVLINQANGSNVTNHNVSLSGALVRNDIVANLNGQGAHTEMNGLVFGSGESHVDNFTEVNHHVANCTSDEYYKTVLDDNSRSVFRGRIVVAEDAQQTNADQQNNNLLLSKNAEADCKPQLEIYADDVKCSHGATVGQLDESSMFYLKSRGINHEDARALLTFAFANEVLERISIQSIKEELMTQLAGELLSGVDSVPK